MVILLISTWYLVGYNLTYDFIVPNASGYGKRWKDWIALWICATLWPLIVLQMLIRLWRWTQRK